MADLKDIWDGRPAGINELLELAARIGIEEPRAWLLDKLVEMDAQGEVRRNDRGLWERVD